MQNSSVKKVFQLLEKVFSSLTFHWKPGFHKVRLTLCFSVFSFIRVNAISLSSDAVVMCM